MKTLREYINLIESIENGISESYGDDAGTIYQEYVANGALNTTKGRKIQKEAERYAGNLGQDAVEYYWVQRMHQDMSPGQAQVLTATRFRNQSVAENLEESEPEDPVARIDQLFKNK